ncbi:RHS repeat-associated protein [Parabacteroides sp. PFB2-12]|uniref:RHS repeat-associated core domain-containing protein n=1 Tax=unclassified Parabacteroides TaxID=2649774 RepID=UPI0024771E65|nr:MULTISPECIES: RHS repeat-associated core domain-containing protein [unclassified Parabacteroides]MDH6342439.1 RHS repeat-associated protein [Parabacteroides sp. PM6-13]MDH6390091.1 RHS repeat-associated protein [Parabacteroides sp. PFB2-12]
MIGSAINTSSLTQTETTDYVGNVEYVNNALKRVYVGTGYIENNVYHCYLKDYLGNTRLVVTPTDNYYQWLNYYPFGMLYGDRGDQGRQQMKYGGKEFEDKHGLYLYDFEARYYDPALGGFLTMDPLAEKYYSTSPVIGSTIKTVRIRESLFIRVSSFASKTHHVDKPHVKHSETWGLSTLVAYQSYCST